MSASQPLLDIADFSVSYRTSKGPVRALDRVSFALGRATRTALVGESGSGKSSIAKAVLGLLPPESATEGALRFGTQVLSDFSHEREWQAIRGRHIALIPQDPLISLDPVQRVGLQIVESLRLHRSLEKEAARAEAVRLLTSVGIAAAADIYDSYPHQLSGGQLQRVLIAIALSGNPSLIIADEPTSGLDVTSQRLVLEEIENLVQQNGTSLLLITHDLAIARKYTDNIIVLQGGSIVEEVPSGQVAESAVPYTRELFEAMPSLHSRRLRPVTVPPREALPRERFAAGSASALARFEKVSKKFLRNAASGAAGGFAGIDGISFDIHPGQSFGLVGESGSGKSTTAKIAAGIIRPDEGEFIWTGEKGPTPKSRHTRARDIQFVFQNPYSSLNPKLTIERTLREPLDALGIGEKPERADLVEAALESVGLPASFSKRRPGELSGGQSQRVAIARAIVVEPKLLILDEPVSALDVTVQQQVLQLLVDLQARLGLSYLFISHDLSVIRLFCDDVAVIRSGKIVEQGAVESVFNHPAHDYTREILAAIP